MKVFVTGVCGQLGHDVMLELRRRGHLGVGSDVGTGSDSGAASDLGADSGLGAGPDLGAGSDLGAGYDFGAGSTPGYVSLDITDAGAVADAISRVRPDAVIHCAAWTAVDAAEEPGNLERVRAINAGGTANLASACRTVGAKMLYISTDYVFDGQGSDPWQPDCKTYKPLNVYGQTKLEGELAVSATLEKYFIVRTAWVFGANGKNFVRTMLALGQKYDNIRVVNDQIGTPTYTADLARLLVDIIETDKYGYYHATNEGGYISWADFAREIFRQAGRPTEVQPVTTAEYGLSRAARPFNSRLDKAKLIAAGFTPLPDWRDALGRYLKEISQTP